MVHAGGSASSDYFADLGFSAEPIYLTDLDRCTPAEALSSQPRRARWRKLDYQTDTASGVMLLAGPDTGAPKISYPVDASGLHAVSIGVYGGHDLSAQLLVKASGDSTFTMLTLPPVQWAGREEIRELFGRVVDLTDQDLVLGQAARMVMYDAGAGALMHSNIAIAYIKLVPLTVGEVTTWNADAARSDTRRLFAHNDAHGLHFIYGPTTEGEIRRHVETYRDTDISRVYWEAGAGDLLSYFSKIGRIATYDGLADFGRVGDRVHAESWRALRDRGIDPFDVALDYTHELGMEFHASYRVAGFHFPPPHDHFNYGATFYKYHPELRSVDREGNRTPRMSYAYPEVRRFVVSLLREMAGYDVDGVCVLYNRRPPVVEYEAPVVEGFKAEFGEDPRQIDESDPRWLTYRARTLTQFHREVREAMDAAAKEQGRRRIEVSAIVMSTEEENLFNAMDLRAWVEEGLVDTLIPYTSEPDLEGLTDAWADPRDIEFFVSLTKGTSCKLAPNLMPRWMSPETYRRRAAALYGAGVENLFLWDCDHFYWDGVSHNRAIYANGWKAVRRLGHRDEIDAWSSAGEPDLETPSTALRKLGDWDLSYVTPG